MDLLGVAYEISTTCSHCQQPLPLNGVGESVLCDNCRTPFPTPQQTWELLLAASLRDTSRWREGAGWTEDVFADRDFKVRHSREDPRCAEPCGAPFAAEQIVAAASAGELQCAKCERVSAVREAPAWMRSLHPDVAFLVGETQGAERARPMPKQVPFNCYHCGAPLPLDGTAHKVKCSFCSNDVVVPDDIWVRLHPAQKVDPWFVVLKARARAATSVEVPKDVSSLIDLCPLDGGIALAWRSNERGAAGHDCRLGLLDASGRMAWIQDGIEFSYKARLERSGEAHTFWLIDGHKDFGQARQIEARTGEPLRTLSRGPSGFSVVGCDRVVLDVDGTFLVHGEWPDAGGHTLRRFDGDANWVPLWSGEGLRLEREVGEWAALVDRPNGLPNPYQDGFRIGRDGALWMWGQGHVARFDRAGNLQKLWPLPDDLVETILDLDATPEGTPFVLFSPACDDEGETWPHLGRIDPDDHFRVIAGLALSRESAITPEFAVLRALSDRKILIGRRSSDLGLQWLDRDGRLLLETNAARLSRQSDLEDLGPDSPEARHLAVDRSALVENELHSPRAAESGWRFDVDLGQAVQRAHLERIEELAALKARSELSRQSAQDEARRKKQEAEGPSPWAWGCIGMIVLLSLLANIFGR